VVKKRGAPTFSPHIQKKFAAAGSRKALLRSPDAKEGLFGKRTPLYGIVRYKYFFTVMEFALSGMFIYWQNRNDANNS
jgi:hypothetical protein